MSYVRKHQINHTFKSLWLFAFEPENFPKVCPRLRLAIVCSLGIWVAQISVCCANHQLWLSLPIPIKAFHVVLWKWKSLLLMSALNWTFFCSVGVQLQDHELCQVYICYYTIIWKAIFSFDSQFIWFYLLILTLTKLEDYDSMFHLEVKNFPKLWKKYLPCFKLLPKEKKNSLR